MKRLVFTILLCWSMAGHSGPGHYEVPVAAYNSGDYATAMSQWRPLAALGNVSALYGLGIMYLQGQGVPQDAAEAVTWFRRAAERGHTEAQFNLGIMYGYGQGVPIDYAESAKWYRMAAEQGFVKAQFNLGVGYASGRGLPQNYAQAYAWWDIAATAGLESAADNRDIVIKRMSASQLEEGQKLSKELWESYGLVSSEATDSGIFFPHTPPS